MINLCSFNAGEVMKNIFRKIIAGYQDALIDYPFLKALTDYAFAFLTAVASAFIFAFGFRNFVTTIDPTATPIVTGGASGLSQVIVLIFKIFSWLGHLEAKTIQSIFYIVLNIPLFFLAFKGIGKRFAVFTIINVAFSSLFIQILPDSWLEIIKIPNDMLARSIFAGTLTGLSSSIAFKAEISGGGIDVISYYISNNKSTSAGKFSLAINGGILTLFSILSIINNGGQTEGALNSFVYGIVYLFVASRLVDAINTRNRKAQMQIITSIPEMPSILLANVPHGCTVLHGVGGYSGENRLVIYIVVSSNEVKQVVKLVRKIDPHSFIDVGYDHIIYGKFFIKPVK